MSHRREGKELSFIRLDSMNGARALQFLADTSRQMHNMEDLPQQLSFILRHLKNVIPFEKAAFYLFNPGENALRCRSSVGMDLEEIERGERTAMRGYPGWVLHSHSPVLLREAEWEANGAGDRTDDRKSLALSPVISGNRFIGVVSIESSRKDAFEQWDLYLLTLFANQLALAIENADWEASARTREKKLLHLLGKAGMAFCAALTDGTLIEANQPFISALGCESGGDVLRMNLFTQLLHPLGKGIELQHRLAKDGSVAGFEIEIRRRDGRTGVGLLSCTSVSDKSGRLVEIQCLLQDVSLKRDFAEDMARIQKLASVGTIARSVAHDFNNLLGGIIGCASLVLSDLDPSDPHHEDIKTILSASKQASELTQQLLSFNKTKGSLKPVSVNDLISEVLKIVSRTMDKRIHIRTVLFPGLLPIEADATRIQQAVMNICLNACDAMPDGGELTLETENTILDGQVSKSQMDMDPGDYVIIRIRDQGTGMDAGTLARIFEPFFTTKPVGKGNGLGLAIAQDIVKGHGGRMFVTSEPNHGSLFEIYLPAIGEPAKTVLQDATTRGLGGQETLLLVDDEASVRHMGKRMLERYGYNVLSASDGEDALRLYKQSPSDIDLLVLDMIMPKMDGKETLRNIRKINPDAKAVLTSGRLDSDYSSRCVREGFSGFIPKPFMTSHFLKVVRQTLDK